VSISANIHPGRRPGSTVTQPSARGQLLIAGIGNLRLDGSRRGDVGVATDIIARVELHNAASIEQCSIIWENPQRGVVVGNGAAELNNCPLVVALTFKCEAATSMQAARLNGT
jgi:hypothetical protein